MSETPTTPHVSLRFGELYHFELIHAVKAGIAALLGYTVYRLMPHTGITAQWILITVLVVMASNSALGTQISRAWYRILATLAGSGLAMALLLLPDETYLVPIALFLVSVGLVFVAVSFSKYAYAATLGAITFCMITFATTAKTTLAVERTAEILLGIIISLVVSVFVFPIRSKKMIVQMSRINLKRIALWYQAVLIEHQDRFSAPAIMRLDAKILESNAAQRQLQANIKFEQRAKQPSTEHCKHLIRSELAYYRYGAVIEVVHRTLMEHEHKSHAILVLSQQFLAHVMRFFNEVGGGRQAAVPQALNDMAETTKELYQVIQAVADAEIKTPAYTLYFIQQRILRVSEHLLEHYQAL